MNPDDPVVAQQIVADYIRSLERQRELDAWPAAVDHLPHPKPTIKSAFKTSVAALIAVGQLDDEMRAFLETAYVSLADYVPSDIARLLKEYRDAASDLGADARLAREKTASAAWQRVAEGGPLVGEIARDVANEAAALRAEFQQFKHA